MLVQVYIRATETLEQVSRLEKMRENGMQEYLLHCFSSRLMLSNRDTVWISTLTKKFFHCYVFNNFGLEVYIVIILVIYLKKVKAHPSNFLHFLVISDFSFFC